MPAHPHLRLATAALLLATSLPAFAQVSNQAAERQSINNNNPSPAANPLPRRAPRHAPSQFDRDLKRDRDARRDGDTTTVSAKFSDPTKPGTLKIALPWADLKIEGTDGDEIVVVSSLPRKGAAEVDKDGFRRLDEEVSFELVEKNNTAHLALAGDNTWGAHGAEFTIKLPRQTNLSVQTRTGGDIEVAQIDGDIDINTMNGEITLVDIGSSAVVNSMNGEIKASFRTAPTKPVSLSSMNGEVDLRLPTDTKANLRLRSHNGSIRTNFPEDILKAKTEKVAGRARAGQTTSYAASAEAREIARAAAEAARAGLEIAREVSREVSREIARAAAEQDAKGRLTAEAPAAPEEPEPAEAPRAPLPPIPPLAFSGGKSVSGTLNGGGTEISVTTMNGSITLRQIK